MGDKQCYLMCVAYMDNEENVITYPKRKIKQSQKRKETKENKWRMQCHIQRKGPGRTIELMRLNLGRHSSILGRISIKIIVLKMIYTVLIILHYTTITSKGPSYHYYYTVGNFTVEGNPPPTPPSQGQLLVDFVWLSSPHLRDSKREGIRASEGVLVGGTVFEYHVDGEH